VIIKVKKTSIPDPRDPSRDPSRDPGIPAAASSEVTRYFVPLLFSTGAPINFLQPIKLFKKANCNILIPLISSYILIYGVNGVRLICRKQ